MRLFVLALLIVLIAPTPAAGARPPLTAAANPPVTAAPDPPLTAAANPPVTAAPNPPLTAVGWRLPVSGPIVRRFDVGRNPYAGGQHRGVDVRAAAGAIVRAPCAGRVVVAGRVGTSGGVVTVLCGRWRATVLPLSTIFVRRHAHVSTRTRVGALARSGEHRRGLHFGVRRDGSRFGYVDPLRFLAARPPNPTPLGRAPRGRPTPPAEPAPARPVAAPRRVAAPSGFARPADLAPWPAWAGLALVLAGAGLGSRRRRVRHPSAAAGSVPARSLAP